MKYKITYNNCTILIVECETEEAAIVCLLQVESEKDNAFPEVNEIEEVAFNTTPHMKEVSPGIFEINYYRK